MIPHRQYAHSVKVFLGLWDMPFTYPCMLSDWVDVVTYSVHDPTLLVSYTKTGSTTNATVSGSTRHCWLQLDARRVQDIVESAGACSVLPQALLHIWNHSKRL
eukprot:4515657-Pleurochrysis_carterae.AAC.2